MLVAGKRGYRCIYRDLTHIIGHFLSPLNLLLSKCTSEGKITMITGHKTCDNPLKLCWLDSCTCKLHWNTFGPLPYRCFRVSLCQCVTCLAVDCVSSKSECNQHSKTRWGPRWCRYQCGKQRWINYVCSRHSGHYDGGPCVTLSIPM